MALFYEEVFKIDSSVDIVSILSLIQDISNKHAEILDLGNDFRKRNNLAWIVARTSITFYDDIKAGDLYIKTFPHYSNGLEYYREYELKQNNQVVARALILFILVNIATFKITVRKDIYHDAEFLAPIYMNKIPKLNNVNNQLMGTYQVADDDIDINHHMNNVKYFKIINQYCLKNNLKNKHVMINYLNQAKLNDVIDIYQEEKNGIISISGYISNEIIFNARVED